MPVLVGPRQPAEFQPQHDSHVVQAHLRHQPSEIPSDCQPTCRFAPDPRRRSPRARPASRVVARTAPGHIAVRGIRGSRALAVATTAAHTPLRADRDAALESSTSIAARSLRPAELRPANRFTWTTPSLRAFIAHLPAVERRVELSNDDAAERYQRPLTLLVRQQVPELAGQHRPHDRRARGERWL